MEGQPLEKKQRLEENAAPKDCDPTLLRADLKNGKSWVSLSSSELTFQRSYQYECPDNAFLLYSRRSKF